MSERGARRVVVTGLGAVSSAGMGADEFTASIRAGRRTTSPVRAFDTSGASVVLTK